MIDWPELSVRLRWVGLSLCFSLPAWADVPGDNARPIDAVRETRPLILVSSTRFLASNYIAVNQFSGNWGGTYSPAAGRNFAVLFSEDSIGLKYGVWTGARFRRKQALVESSRGLTDIVHANLSSLAVPEGQKFGLQFAANGMEVVGSSVERSLSVTETECNYCFKSLSVGFNWLEGVSARMGELSGSATSTADGYSYSTTSSHSFSEQSYPFIRAATPHGTGYSINLGGEGSLGESWRWKWTGQDLGGRMHWKDMPFSMQNTNTSNAVRDPAGYIRYDPIMSGWNDLHRRDVTQQIDPRYSAELTKQLELNEFKISAERMQQLNLFGIAGVFRPSDRYSVEVGHEFRLRIHSITIRNDWIALKILSDSLSLPRAKSYGFSLQAAIPLP